MDGSTGWLWCFTPQRETYDLIDDGRGREVLDEFFGGVVPGILVTDFWAAYTGMSQKCWPHLLRDLRDGDGPEFAEKLRRLFRDVVNRDARREELKPAT